MKHKRRYPKGGGVWHPTIEFSITTAYAWDLLPFIQSHRILTPAVTVRPDEAHLFVSRDPWIDVRATDETAYLSGRRHESEWVITVIAYTADEAYDALDQEVEDLTEDVQVGDIAIGRHRGTRWTIPKFQHPLETMTQRYHEEALRMGRFHRTAEH